VASNSIEQALYVYLTSSTALTTLVGNRVYLAKAEVDSARPYVVFTTVSDVHAPFAFGEANSGQPRVQFSVFHSNRYSALSIAHTIRKRLRFYSGSMDGMTVHSLTVGGTLLMADPEQDVFQATFDVMPIYIDAS